MCGQGKGIFFFFFYYYLRGILIFTRPTKYLHCQHYWPDFTAFGLWPGCIFLFFSFPSFSDPILIYSFGSANSYPYTHITGGHNTTKHLFPLRCHVKYRRHENWPNQAIILCLPSPSKCWGGLDLGPGMGHNPPLNSREAKRTFRQVTVWEMGEWVLYPQWCTNF
jgi:hypothetical protein